MLIKAGATTKNSHWPDYDNLVDCKLSPYEVFLT